MHTSETMMIVEPEQNDDWQENIEISYSDATPYVNCEL